MLNSLEEKVMKLSLIIIGALTCTLVVETSHVPINAKKSYLKKLFSY